MIGDTNATTIGKKVAWNCIEISPHNYYCWGYATIATGPFVGNSVTITFPVADANNGQGRFPQVTWLNVGSGWASAFLTVDPPSRTATSFRVYSWGTDSSMPTMNRDFSWSCIVMTA